MSGYAATNGAAYEKSMGRWSRKLADAMLDALALPPGMSVLEAGCGTGALADALAMRDPSARITGIDISPAFLDAALSLLVLQFVPDRAKAVAEMLRVTKPGGLVAAAMWDFTGGFSFLRAFADSVAITEPEGEAFRARYWADPVGAPGRMAALFTAAGVDRVTETDIAIRQDFTDFEDWWDPWAAGGQGIAGAFIATLPPERIPPIKEIVRRAYLAGGADGPRSFVAVARLAVGRKPIRP